MLIFEGKVSKLMKNLVVIIQICSFLIGLSNEIAYRLCVSCKSFADRIKIQIQYMNSTKYLMQNNSKSQNKNVTKMPKANNRKQI